ncbi:MAG: hypothetical protein ACYC44_01245 [Patescibacteria group bacterium]
MQKFDIPSLKVNPEATPAHETPSKRKFSMMEAKPKPREVPDTEALSARRRSLRLVKPEAEEAERVASIRKSFAEASYKQPTDVDKLRAKTKSLKGRIEALVGHSVKGKTAEEIKANVSLGDRFSAWLSKISGKKTESLSDLLNQLHVAEKTLEVKLTPEISVVEPAAPPRKPKTLRSIKTRIEEAKAKSESRAADEALENLHVEVDIGARIEAAKARGKKNMTLGEEDIIPEIKTSAMAESVRMPEAEEEVEIPVHFEEETAEEAPNLKQQLSDIGLEDAALVFGYLDNPDIKQKGLKLVELFKAEEARVGQLEEEIANLEKERDEALDKATDKKTNKSIKRQYSQKINRLRQTVDSSGKQWIKEYESRKADLENLAKEAQTKGETKRSELAEEMTEEKFAGEEAKGIESNFWNNSLDRLNNRVSALSKTSANYMALGKLKNDPKVSKQVLELVRQDVNHRIKDDSRLTEESLLKEGFETRLINARKAKDKEAEAAIKAEYDKALQAFNKQTLDIAYQWATRYEEELDKIAAMAKDIEEEAALPKAEIIEEKAPSEMAPPPPTASERKKKSELLDAIAGKAGPTVEVGEGELRPEEIKAAYGEPEEVPSQGEKIVKAATKFLEENEEIAKAGWLGQILRDYPLVEKHKADPAVARILDDIRHHLAVFNARRDGMVERFKRKPKKVTQEFKEMTLERSEFVNRAIDELEAVAKNLEKPAVKKIEKTPSLRAKEKADPYHNLRQELRERIRDEKQIEDYIQLASQRDRYLRENDEVEAALYQARIDTFNTAWRELGMLGVKEDPSVTTTGKSGIGRMGVIGRNLASDRIQRGKYEGDVPSGVREKTRSTLEVTRRLKTKELQPFNTAWAMERMGAGAAKRWDMIAPVIMERKLGPVIAREINNMVQQIDKLDESEKNLLSDEYRNLSKMMGIVRNTPRFNQSPESAAYIFLRALKPDNFSDFLAQDIVEATLNKLDEMIAKAEQESAKKKANKKKEEEQGFSMMRAKPKPRGTEPKTESNNKPVVPKTKKARTVRAPGKSEAA